MDKQFLNNITDGEQKEAFDFLLKDNHVGVIFGVLKKLHVFASSPYYEDMIQDGVFYFIDAYQNAPQEKPEDRMAFIYQSMIWKMTDFLRKERVLQGYLPETANEESNEEILLSLHEKDVWQDSHHQIHYEQLMKICSDNERKYLRASFELGMNITQIAKYYKVSRPTIYLWREGLRRKFKEIQ